MTDDAGMRMPLQPQSIDAPLSGAAVFLTLTLSATEGAADRARSVLGDVGGLVRAVGFRDLDGRLSCVVGIGSDVWDSVTRLPRPAQLHPFEPVRGSVHTAVATPGDLFFHIRADRADLCFEFERLLLESLGSDVDVADETVGFRYFDARDLLGFVDGTENPTGDDIANSTIVGSDDASAAGGSYIVVQKYLHDLAGWQSLTTEVQEAIIGRRKADNVELKDGQRASHKTLATIVDEGGVEHDILRDNMPFGRPGLGEFGTYFIGYSRDLWVIERMLQNMFVGVPTGSYDRMLDFATPVTGAVFFAPSNAVISSFGG
ncbi:Dyp-type peroxidase [Microbacteriaceae bacterium VKM Ac-2855]|nr:Dyp-type peroxidase [Microbacteriaceae bacterium VKM Ac-2855]